ncbi:hypothetical protein ACQKOE_08180 [Novosphingobium sp. NPDC080210]|uniref:hypothetical protein n=1 Tax=Novosphingobium sp. NPDC080210 TaxID=3390596 RepID=UPI003D03A5BE
MRTSTKFIAAIVAALAMPALASPEAIEEKKLATGKQKLDLASGYIFIQSNFRTFGTFLRVPDESTQAEYQKDLDEAFAKAQKKYPGQFKNWETEVSIAKQTGKAPPARPVEPSKENITIDAIELRDMASFGPMFIYNKDEAAPRFNYLTAVKPGTYIYYGPVLMQPGVVAGGQCMCMGTVRFEVKPGVITDLGNFLVAAPDSVKGWDVVSVEAWKRAEEKAAKKGEPVEAPVQQRPKLAFGGVPETLKDLPVVQAEFHAHGKLNNYYALMFTRMPPIPGILAYRRDTVIDLRTGQDVPNPVIKTQVKIKK